MKARVFRDDNEFVQEVDIYLSWFDFCNSNPIAEVDEAVVKYVEKISRLPTVVEVDFDAHRALQSHPLILDRLKHCDLRGGRPNYELLSQIFDVDTYRIDGILSDSVVDRYWYLATPYRAYPYSLETAFDAACRFAAKFFDAGVMVYSPIAHSHPIARHTTLAPDADEWVRIQEVFMAPARGMILVEMEGWERSNGIDEERCFFRRAKRPIIRVKTDDPVSDFRRMVKS